MKEKELQAKASASGYVLKRHNKPRRYSVSWAERVIAHVSVREGEIEGEFVLTESGTLVSERPDRSGMFQILLAKESLRAEYQSVLPEGRPASTSDVRLGSYVIPELDPEFPEPRILFETGDMSFEETDVWIDLAGIAPAKDRSASGTGATETDAQP